MTTIGEPERATQNRIIKLLSGHKTDAPDGIRQTLDNQDAKFIRHFFTTNQICFAGNDSEGMRYAGIQTPQPYWLAWKEDSDITQPLDRDVTQMLSPVRFLEIIHDFTLFDAGSKRSRAQISISRSRPHKNACVNAVAGSSGRPKDQLTRDAPTTSAIGDMFDDTVDLTCDIYRPLLRCQSSGGNLAQTVHFILKLDNERIKTVEIEEAVAHPCKHPLFHLYTCDSATIAA